MTKALHELMMQHLETKSTFRSNHIFNKVSELKLLFSSFAQRKAAVLSLLKDQHNLLFSVISTANHVLPNSSKFPALPDFMLKEILVHQGNSNLYN